MYVIYVITQRMIQPEYVHINLEVGANRFNRIWEFKYLDALKTQNNDVQYEIKSRIQASK